MTEEEILVLPRAVKATKKSHLYTRLTLMLKLSRGTINWRSNSTTTTRLSRISLPMCLHISNSKRLLCSQLIKLPSQEEWKKSRATMIPVAVVICLGMKPLSHPVHQLSQELSSPAILIRAQLPSLNKQQMKVNTLATAAVASYHHWIQSNTKM